jgi:hypothetical protein
MIIIRTANGCEFINDEDISRITHNKKEAKVYIYKGPFPSTIKQVVSITYTTKKDKEYEDKGSLLTAALKDVDYFRKMSHDYESYAKRLYANRDELERFIIRKDEDKVSESSYRCFIDNILKERNERPNRMDDEINIYDIEYHHSMIDNAEKFGKEVTSWFEDMTLQISEKDMKISEQRKIIAEQQGEIKRLKQRTLWERITRKGE